MAVAQQSAGEPNPSRRAIYFAAGFVICATLFAYANSFSGELIFDDVSAIADNPSIRSLWPLTSVFSPRPECPTAGRPLANLSFALNYAFGGTNVWGYHATNLALHVLATLVLFGIVRRTFAWMRDAESGRISPSQCGPSEPLAIALAVSVLWSVHPLLTEAVAYISQRTEVLMGLCYFATIYSFIRAVQDSSRAWLSTSVATCFAGMASKEGMVTAPVIVLIYDRVFFAGSFLGAWRLRRNYYLALVASWLLLGMLLTTGLGYRGVGYGIGVTWWNYLLTECFVVLNYVRLFFWPHPLIFDYGPVFSLSLLQVWLACTAVLSLLVAAIFAFLRWPRTGFLTVVFFALLAPTSSVVPVAAQPMAESRMYLPSAALATLCVVGVRRCLGVKSGALLGAFLIPMVALSVMRTRIYGDASLLWRDTVLTRPANPRAYYSLGLIAEQKGQLDEARIFFETALAIKPDYDVALNEFGRLLIRLGSVSKAQRLLEQAVRLKPNFPEAYLNLGVALRRLGDVEGARRQFEVALHLRLDFTEAHYNLGNALLLLGREAEAVGHFEEALRLRPDLADAHLGLGTAFFRQGRFGEALVHYKEALRLRPESADIQENLERLRGFLRANQASPDKK